MRALVHDHPGSAADLYVSEAEMPTPGPGEVRVRVYAAGLNPVDGKLLGADNPAWSWPHIPGLDFAGVVDALGPGVTGLSVGQAVAGHGAINSEGTATESLHLLGFNGQLGSLPQFTTAPPTHEITLGAAHTSGDPRALG